MIVKLLTFLLIFGLIALGIRKIVNDWRARFRDLDKQTRERDLRERDRSDVVNLQKGEDGVFRPGSARGPNRAKEDEDRS